MSDNAPIVSEQREAHVDLCRRLIREIDQSRSTGMADQVGVLLMAFRQFLSHEIDRSVGPPDQTA